MNEIRVKYLRQVEPLEHIGGAGHSNWIDLRCAEDVDMKAGEYRLIPLGVAMQLPAGYEAIVAPRSSTFKKYGILQANGIGIIDESYCGDTDEWHFPAYATRDTHIAAGERICQFRTLWHMQKTEVVIVEELGNKPRGGIGSTGRF